MISIYGGWTDVVLFNIIFWTVYSYVCSLPYKAFQATIDGHGLDQ